jgi:hypothetical protein
LPAFSFYQPPCRKKGFSISPCEIRCAHPFTDKESGWVLRGVQASEKFRLHKKGGDAYETLKGKAH